MVKHIRIISPSGHLDSSYIEDASARLSVWGYEVSEGEHARDEYGRFAAPDEQRLEDLTNALADPSVDVLVEGMVYSVSLIVCRQSPNLLSVSVISPLCISWQDLIISRHCMLSCVNISLLFRRIANLS